MAVPVIPYEVIFTLPHDSSAYTQGLLYHDQLLWESTGRYGESTVRKVDPQSGRVLLSRPLPDTLFGEGMALVGSELVQLTWKEGVALVRDLDSLAVQRTHRYEGEGWGLCFDGTHLYMSNGSDSLYVRDPATFSVVAARPVRAAGRPVRQLNELECVGERVWANVYQEDYLVEIDKRTGNVLRQLDGTRLRLGLGIASGGENVLNGVAWEPRTGVFFLTGKLWPAMYVVRLLEDAPADPR